MQVMRRERSPYHRKLLVLLTHIFLLLLTGGILVGCQPPPVIRVSHYDPSRAYNGYTYFQTYDLNNGYFCVDMNGQVLWQRKNSLAVVGHGAGLDVAHDGNVLVLPLDNPTMINPVANKIVWAWNKTPPLSHHSIIMTPRGSVMFLELDLDIPVESPPWDDCSVFGDVIKEVDIQTHEVLWEWHLHHYVDPVEHHNEDLCTLGEGLTRGDWSHSNTVKYYEDYWFNGQNFDVVLLNARNLSTFYMIDYATSEILWSCGQHGTFGRREPPEEPLFSYQHEVDMLPNGNVIMFDNGNERVPQVSRALEISVDPVAGTVEEVWSWTEPNEIMFDLFMGDATRLPNGNTLLTNVLQGRLIEVTPDGEKVWQLDMEYGSQEVWMYKCERVEPWPSCLDSDTDGYGDPAVLTCPNWGQDCDDADPEVNPGAAEESYSDAVCSDTIDNDCDGLVDEDDPGCQLPPECTVPQDCDDGNACTDDDCVDFACLHVNNVDPCDDGYGCTMNDACAEGMCTGEPLDEDGDGYVSNACGGQDCDDSDPEVNPGAAEESYGDAVCGDGVDNDCDGYVDMADNGCQECMVPEDCDDGLWCNGQEACADFVCQQGLPPDCSDTIDCTDDSCNEDFDSCENTPDNTFCDDGNACTDDVCNPAAGCEYACNASGPGDPCCEDPLCAGAPVCEIPT